MNRLQYTVFRHNVQKIFIFPCCKKSLCKVFQEFLNANHTLLDREYFFLLCDDMRTLMCNRKMQYMIDHVIFRQTLQPRPCVLQ